MFRVAQSPAGSCRSASVPPWKRKARRSLKLIASEGATDKSAHAVSDNFAVPLALVLGAGPFAIGVLAAFPRLAAAVSQLFAPVAIEKMRSYRRVLILSAMLGALSFGLVGVVPWLPDLIRIPALVVLVSIGMASLEFATPALGCWVSDQVPVTRRGSYMAWRYGLAGAATIAVLVLGGPFLDSMQGRVVIGLVALFGVASGLRVLAAVLFLSAVERAQPEPRSKPPTLGLLADTLRRTNFGRFLVYAVLMHFGTFVAAPFFTPYQLQVLGFSYSGLLMPIVVLTVFGMLGAQVFGRLADRVGNLVLLRAAAFAMPVIPLLWMLVQVPLHAALLNVVTGLAWAIFNLCSINFVLELSGEKDRANNVSFLFFGIGIAMFAGAITGALVFQHLPELAGSRYLTMFVVSAVLRLVPALVLVRYVSEPRRRRRSRLAVVPTPASQLTLRPSPSPAVVSAPAAELPTAA